MEGIAKSAVNILEKKYMPEVSSVQSFVPEELYKSLFPMLEIWDRETTDEDIQLKTKFIYEQLGENPRDKLMSLFTDLGPLPQGENKVDRIHRYLKLKSEANKFLTNYETIQRELNGFRTR